MVLAQSVDRFNITATPSGDRHGYDRIIDDPATFVSLDTIVNKLGSATGTSPSDLRAAIEANPKSQFAYLDKGVSLSVLRAVQKLGFAGISYENAPARSYPNGAVGGNLVGFVGTDGPQAGIELAYNSCLAPKNGESTYQTGADGTRIPAARSSRRTRSTRPPSS